LAYWKESCCKKPLRELTWEHHAGGDTCIVRDLVHILSVGTLWGPKQQHNIKTSFDPFMSLFEDKLIFSANHQSKMLNFCDFGAFTTALYVQIHSFLGLILVFGCLGFLKQVSNCSDKSFKCFLQCSTMSTLATFGKMLKMTTFGWPVESM